MSTVQEQLAALRAGTVLPPSAPVQAEVETVSKEDVLLSSIFDLGLFDAIVPTPADGERVFEYEERRKQFNLILHDFISEQLNALQSKHDEELADVHTRLQSAQDALDYKESAFVDLQQDYDRLESEHKELKEAFEKSKEEKKYEAPSEPLKNRIASLKQLSADDMVARFNERQAAKGGVQASDATFPAAISLPNIGDNQLPLAIEVPSVTFPTVEVTSGSEPVQADSAIGELVSQEVKDYIEQRLEQFKQELQG